MGSGTTVRLKPHEVALLRGGPRAAVTVAVLALHLLGAVEAGRPGTVRVSGEPAGAGQALSPLSEAVLTSLQQPAGVTELLDQPSVRQALDHIRGSLLSADLLRTLPPRRTRAARRALDALYAAHPLPAGRRGLSADDTLMAVALYGDPALTVLAARFALRAGLTARVEVADKGLLRHSERSPYSCGGVSD
ncbi:TIGR04222 domain-containing membrane protein [Streptomyces sp. NPDC050997]|uniref:TIGR04222 domain-containing membrane protein n=1 Tax=Streptomyces sp. NPDC050997 TaxID=3155519 RepID=UPI0034166AE0